MLNDLASGQIYGVQEKLRGCAQEYQREGIILHNLSDETFWKIVPYNFFEMSREDATQLYLEELFLSRFLALENELNRLLKNIDNIQNV